MEHHGQKLIIFRTTAKRVGLEEPQTAVVWPSSGTPGPGGQAPQTEKWDGTSWTNANNMNGGHMQGSGAGTSNTSGLVVGGEGPGTTANCETYDGTCLDRKIKFKYSSICNSRVVELKPLLYVRAV